MPDLQTVAYMSHCINISGKCNNNQYGLHFSQLTSTGAGEPLYMFSHISYQYISCSNIFSHQHALKDCNKKKHVIHISQGLDKASVYTQDFGL